MDSQQQPRETGGGPRPPLSEMQWEVMRAVWQLREATVSEVWRHLQTTRPWARNTILTQMDRLVRKGWLSRREEGRVFHYRAAETLDAARQDHLRRWVESAFSGAADQLVLTLLESDVLSDEEITRIRQRIDQARRKT